MIPSRFLSFRLAEGNWSAGSGSSWLGSACRAAPYNAMIGVR